MAEVDTSIYNKLNAHSEDPIKKTGEIVNIARGLNQNKLFQQEFNTNIGLGEAYKNSIGPDGQIDQNRLTKNIVDDPRTSWNLPQALKSVADQKQSQVGLEASKMKLAQEQMSIFRNGLGTFLDQKNPKKSDIIDFVGKLVSHKIITPQQAATEMANMPAEGTPAMYEWLRSHYLKALTNEQQLGVIAGNVQPIGTGGGTATPRVKALPRPGETGIEEGGGFANTPTPGTTFYNPETRSEEKVSRGQPGPYQPPRRREPQVQPLDEVPGQTRTPAPNEQRTKPKNQDRIPSGNMAPAGPPLGERQGAEQTAGESGSQLGQDLRKASNFTRDVYPLTQAIPALEKLGKTGTGPGAETLNHYKSFLQTLGIPGIDVEKIKKFDEANKYLTDFVNQNGNTGTNDKLAAAFAGNPSTKVSNAAAVDVAKAALALRRLQHAQALAFEATGKPESEYTKWAAKFNTTQDPRAYGVDYMSKKAYKAMAAEMPEGSAERKKFNESYKLARQLGLVGKPNEK